ncbi:hypothetical protein P7K49_030187 [Saguinus oedipus]|uniref:Uncharacterized protein n=1 Tax=Saguinus oedipus TaxID=9490 RepID=A0ABQ9U1H6_SAGOE|nr:hypothetical protein P7K49_030187 [Saguinus oedipus]
MVLTCWSVGRKPRLALAFGTVERNPKRLSHCQDLPGTEEWEARHTVLSSRSLWLRERRERQRCTEPAVLPHGE